MAFMAADIVRTVRGGIEKAKPIGILTGLNVLSNLQLFLAGAFSTQPMDISSELRFLNSANLVAVEYRNRRRGTVLTFHGCEPSGTTLATDTPESVAFSRNGAHHYFREHGWGRQIDHQ